MPRPDLAAALAGGGIRATYQPIADLLTRRPVAHEALARGPEGTALHAPAALFDAAYEDDCVADLDRACVLAAVDGARAAAAACLDEIVVFVNVEPVSLVRAAPAEWVHTPPGLRLVVEVTERALTSDPAGLLRSIATLREVGVGIALDDVGSDPATLALLPLVVPDVVKLDLSLVQDQTSVLASIANACLAHAERTGAVVLAEGIETEAHLETALGMGATLGQGWLFGRPLPELGSNPAEGAVPSLGSPPAPASTPVAAVKALGMRMRSTAARHLVPMRLLLAQTVLDARERCVVLASAPPVASDLAGMHALNERAALCVAFGRDLPDDPDVRCARLAADDPLLDEEVFAVLGPHFAGALVSRPIPGAFDDDEQVHEFLLTHERAVVLQIVRALVDRVPPLI